MDDTRARAAIEAHFGDPWEPPAWRARWGERFDLREPDPPPAVPPRQEDGPG